MGCSLLTIEAAIRAGDEPVRRWLVAVPEVNEDDEVSGTWRRVF